MQEEELQTNCPHVTCQQCEKQREIPSCQQILHKNTCLQHKNLHIPPHEHFTSMCIAFPKKLSLATLYQDDEQDLAIRSILPDQIPKQEVGKRVVSPLEHPELNTVDIKTNQISQPNPESPIDISTIPMDIKGLEQQKYQLDIEKEIQIKPKITNIMKKTVNKYQNTNNGAQQAGNMGGCQKKPMGGSLPQSRNTNPIEPIYEEIVIQPIVIQSRKPSVTISFPVNIPPAKLFVSIPTKISNQKKQMSQPKEPSELTEPNNSEFQPNFLDFQCRDCHGFYCSTCKSTIPPNLRPFWNEDEKPEIIQLYKSRQKRALEKRLPGSIHKHQ